jgi:TolB-like protein
MNNLLAELKRRNVIRVAGVYAVVGWVLAQIATTMEEALGLPAWFDGVIVALLLLGLPIALVLAWAFELTPDGVLRTEDVPEGASITPDTGRKLDFTIVAGLVFLAAMIIWQQATKTDSPTNEIGAAPATDAVVSVASIAVLPFADLSPEGDQEYFSDGISEEILNVLVGVKGLEIVSRTSSFQFKGRDLGIPEIAELLKVRHVVEGSVRKSGETIRVTAQLIDAANDKHLWSDTYDRPLTAENLFSIQDEISNAIVAALSDALGVGVLTPVVVSTATRNLTAYELFLQARPLYHARQRLDEVDEMLEQALLQDSEFAEAWEMRAALQTLMLEYGFSSEPVASAVERSDEFASRALELQPNSGVALAVRGKNAANANENLRLDISPAEIMGMFDKALQVKPRNPDALNWRGLRHTTHGMLEAGLADFAQCMEYEPFYRPCVDNHTSTLSALGRDEEALQWFLDALNKSSGNVYYGPFASLARLDKELTFKSMMNHDNLLEGWRRHGELYQAYRNPHADHTELIASIRAHMMGKDLNLGTDFEYLVMYIGHVPEKPDRLIMWDKGVRPYRQTAEFKSYMRKTGIVDYWREFGFPPLCRPLGGDDFECD